METKTPTNEEFEKAADDIFHRYMTALKNLSKSKEIRVSREYTEALGKLFWLMADEYRFSDNEAMLLLGIEGEKSLQKYKKSKKIKASLDSYNRVGKLLRIKRCLDTLLQNTPESKSDWFRVPRKAFEDKSAIDFLTEDATDVVARLTSMGFVMEQFGDGELAQLAGVG